MRQSTLPRKAKDRLLRELGFERFTYYGPWEVVLYQSVTIDLRDVESMQDRDALKALIARRLKAEQAAVRKWLDDTIAKLEEETKIAPDKTIIQMHGERFEKEIQMVDQEHDGGDGK